MEQEVRSVTEMFFIMMWSNRRISKRSNGPKEMRKLGQQQDQTCPKTETTLERYGQKSENSLELDVPGKCAFLGKGLVQLLSRVYAAILMENQGKPKRTWKSIQKTTILKCLKVTKTKILS